MMDWLRLQKETHLFVHLTLEKHWYPVSLSSQTANEEMDTYLRCAEASVAPLELQSLLSTAA
jgi:hypothetical protein